MSVIKKYQDAFWEFLNNLLTLKKPVAVITNSIHVLPSVCLSKHFLRNYALGFSKFKNGVRTLDKLCGTELHILKCFAQNGLVIGLFNYFQMFSH